LIKLKKKTLHKGRVWCCDSALPQVVNIEKLARVVGYGLQSLYSSVRISYAFIVEGQAVTSLQKALLLCIGFTWLNPHVYLHPPNNCEALSQNA
jgi:arginine exporter protein ArgO